VLANIVGILIILIVIVGLRVQNAPLPSAPAEEHSIAEARAHWAEEVNRINTANDVRRREHDHAVRLHDKELAQRQQARERRQKLQRQYEVEAFEVAAEASRRRQLNDEYARRAAQIEREIAQLTEELSRRTTRPATPQDAGTVAAREAKVTLLDAAWHNESASIEQLHRQQQSLEAQLAEIEAAIARLKAEQKPADQIVHYLTPVSRKVDKTELHFRCLGTRVAYTHLDDLLELVRQRARTAPPPGRLLAPEVVGPVGGFVLRYRIGRRDATLSQQLRDPFSSGYVLAGWELLAESATLGDDANEALGETSKFRTTLSGKSPEEYAVTLWVYPDSFGLAHKLRDWLHQAGYTVAQRPLPFGVSIAGTPYGSASRGQ
jgi:hypothetical protein